MDDEVRLFEFDKIEWRDIVRHVRPDLNDDEFDALWAKFLERKRARELQ